MIPPPLAARVRAHRRRLHRLPETAWNEHQTAAYVEEVLGGLGIASRRVVGTGVVAVVPGDGPGVVAVRADMDALPVTEAEGRPGYRSEVPGTSHACGHDAHVAIALGLAEAALTSHPLPGTLVLYLQPAEESGGGAAPMVEAGVMADPVPQAVLALHAAPQHRVGLVGVREGPTVGSFDDVTITVRGVGGHAAHPDGAVDPVATSAAIIMAVNQLLAREIAPTSPATITFGSIHGGAAHNVIPPEVVMQASVRAIDAPVRRQLLDRLTHVVHGIAAAHRATAVIDVTAGYPPGANTPSLARLVRAAAADVLGERAVVEEPVPSLGAEDFFAFGADGTPVCMFRLGVGNPEEGITGALHSPEFDIDEDALDVGVAVMAAAARAVLTS